MMKKGKVALAVHGGAGPIPKKRYPKYQKSIRAVLEKGVEILNAGASAVEVVEACVRAMEDDEIFNAGIGSTLRSDGSVVMDAAIVDGAKLRFGAVGTVRYVANPISLARRIMEEMGSAFLVGKGAEMFARRCGLKRMPAERFVTERRRKQWERKVKKLQDTHGETDKLPASLAIKVSGGGEGTATVGAVCRDVKGALAAATSTGGLFFSHPSRVGDTPVIGAGTYADSICAVSATGIGEAIIKSLLSKQCASFVENGITPMKAASLAIERFLESTKSEAGLIVVDRLGRVGYAYCTLRMAFGYFTPSSGIVVPS